MKKIIIPAFVGLLALGIVTAGWFLGFADSVTARIISSEGEPIILLAPFEDFELNTTSSMQNTTAWAISEFENTNADIDMKINLIESISDVETDSCNPESDCFSIIQLDGIKKWNNQLVTITKGSHELNWTLNCKAWSCPHNLSLEVQLTPT